MGGVDDAFEFLATVLIFTAEDIEEKVVLEFEAGLEWLWWGGLELGEGVGCPGYVAEFWGLLFDDFFLFGARCGFGF